MLHPDMNRFSMREAVLFVTPILMAVSSVLHPLPPFSQPGMFEFLRPRLALWLFVHVEQLLLVLLLGLVLWFLTEGLASRAATVSRLATAFFLVFYTSFDSVVGIATGLVVKSLEGVRALDPAIASDVVDGYWLGRFGPPVMPLIVVASLSWVIAVIGAAVALRAIGAPRAAIILLIIAAIAFGVDHPMPPGTVGMLALFAANVILYRHSMLTIVQRTPRSSNFVPQVGRLSN